MGSPGIESKTCNSSRSTLGLEAVFAASEERGSRYGGNYKSCWREEFTEREGIDVVVIEARGFGCGG